MISTLSTPATGHEFISPIQEIIAEARNGRMVIMVDDEDRENEGDLVVPAQMATPEAINFMATHGRGLICLALTKERTEQLGLQPIAAENGTRHETAFTTSIEARDGVTTGISASDRARTVAVAINTSHGAEHIVTPGHIFPLAARPGGVLVRAGHTEAAVDISRLAGLNPSGVICEIMNDDGTMARLDDLIPYAQRHRLKIGTISDLIAYRRRHDHNVVRVAEAHLQSEWGGDWATLVFRNKAIDTETMVLVKGKIDPAEPTLVRMHAVDFFADTLGHLSNRSSLLARSMKAIGEAGRGVVVLISKPVPMSQVVEGKAGRRVSDMVELRDYGVGAQILSELGIHDMILLTNSHHTLVALSGYGLNVVEERRIEVA